MARNGSGIVVCSGGWRLPMTWANIAMLRALGTTLPIEVWHLPGELTRAGKELLHLVGAKPRLLRVARDGYFNVPFALAETGFGEVVVLDSDLTPLVGLDGLLDDPEYLRWGALLAPDLLDIRRRDFYPEAWQRLGLEPPACPTAARCHEAWETDSAVMVLNLRRCRGGTGVLRALAADAAGSDRYGWAGDKELYQLAWRAVGCPPAFLRYPALLGQASAHLGFVGLALAHHMPGGELLGVHWAWSKSLLHHSVPSLGAAASPPRGGYAAPTEHRLNHPEEVAAGILAASGEVREHFYFLRLGQCFTQFGEPAACDLGSPDAQVAPKLAEFGALLSFARWALGNGTCSGGSGTRCRPRRSRLPAGARAMAKKAFPRSVVAR